MADPATWAMMAAVANVASQAVQGIQAYQQGMHESAIAGQNAQIASDNAARARRDADLAEEAHRREARQTLGRMAAAAAQSGAAAGGPGQGSAGLVIGQSAKLAELDAQTIRYGGEMERFALETQASQFRAEQKAARQRAKGGLLSGVLGAAAAGLSGTADYSRTRADTRGPQIKKPTPTRAPDSLSPRSRRTHYTRLPRMGGY